MDASPPSPSKQGVESPAPRRARWRVPLIVLGSIVGVVGPIVVGVYVFDWLATEVPVTENDKAAVLRAAHLTEWVEGLEIDPALETFRKPSAT